MAVSPHMRVPFDPGRDLLALREFDFLDKHFGPGDPVPRDLADQRKMRQLYDAHYVDMGPKAEKKPYYVNDSPEKIELSILGPDELTEFLTKRGIIPRHGTSRIKLLQRAEELLQAERKATKAA